MDVFGQECSVAAFHGGDSTYTNFHPQNFNETYLTKMDK